MANMTTDTLSKANGIAQDFKSQIQNTEHKLEKMSRDAGKKMGAMASDIADTTTAYVNTGRDYVKENPVKGVAIAAAAGVVAGSLLTLALRRRSQP